MLIANTPKILATMIMPSSAMGALSVLHPASERENDKGARDHSGWRTVTTGMGACRTIHSATLPSIACFNPVLPWVPSTTMS